MKAKFKKIHLFCLIFSLVVCNSFFVQAFAEPVNTKDLLKAYCGSAVLKEAFVNLKLSTPRQDSAINELNQLADQQKGFNSLYEIELSARKAGLKTIVLKTDLINLRLLPKGSQLIVNITGNRHFCLIEDISEDKISVYIPGLNYERFSLTYNQFLEYWDNVALVVSKNNIRLNKYKLTYKSVTKNELKRILGAQPCENVTGNTYTYTGSGGSGRLTIGNSSGQSTSDSSVARPAASTTEPVIIQNGNLFLTSEDITIPTVTRPLTLTRYYNAEIVSEIPGWHPEPGAGSWVIEDGEYSGQGNRSATDLKFKNFTLELDMQTIQPGNHYSWETAWINFRYAEDPNDQRKPKDCYYFLIHTDGKIELTKWRDGVYYYLLGKQTAYLPVNKNHIKIEAVDSNIKIYVNGALEIDYADIYNPVLLEGRIALESYFSHSHFDNIKITSGTQIYNYAFDADDNEFIFGYGWTHSFSMKVKEYSDHVTLYRENNSKEIYVPNGDGSYFSVPVNYYSKLTKDAGGFSLKTKYGVHYRFDLSGVLQYIEDRNSNRIDLTYGYINGKFRLVNIAEPAGRKISLEYGANNMVSKATDPSGNYLQYLYDTDGHLIKIIDRQANITNYAYDLITHNLKELVDPEGNIFKYNYAYNDRVNDQLDPKGDTTTFEYLWSTVHVINKRGELYKYNFDANGFLQSIMDARGAMESTNNDANGNIVDFYDKNANHTAFTYDVQGNRTIIVDALGNQTTYVYEQAYNQPISATDANGNITVFSYDAKGNLIQTVNPESAVTTYAYNSCGQVISATNANGQTTYFSYDAYGNLSILTDSLGNNTSYTYDILGRLIKVTDALNNSTEYNYDKNGNLLNVKDALLSNTTSTYNKNGNLSSVADPLGNKTSYTYDCFGNLLTVTNALGNTTTSVYDTANQMHLNKANLLSVTDAKGNRTAYAYDSMGRLITITDAQSHIVEFTYDSQGNLTYRRDAKGKNASYKYDRLNRLWRMDCLDGTYFQYTFDKVGNIVQENYSTDTIIKTYDKLNRLKSQSTSDGTVLSYTYDLSGNRTGLYITGFGRVSYWYDNLNRLIRIASPEGKITQFSYDKLSRRTQLNYPNAATAIYAYDNIGRLTQLINKDSSGNDISRFNYFYDAASRRTTVSLINGTMNYTYDKISQLVKEEGAFNGKPSSINYTYDAVGNRMNLNDNGLLIDYTYNNLNQLIWQSKATQRLVQVKGVATDVAGLISGPVSVKVNGIDAIANGGQFIADYVPLKVGQNTIKAEAVDMAGNSSTAQEEITFDPGALTYTYDNNGNLSQRQTSTYKEEFWYDDEDRLESYISPTNINTFRYNGRAMRKYTTSTDYYVYDFNEIVKEKPWGYGLLPIYYIHSPRTDEIISDSRGYCYHYDGLGSVVNLTDASGVKQTSYLYDSFGNIRFQEGTVTNQWLYTGRQYDRETGLYYYRNRYYDPQIGRFITRDPLGMVDGPNLYSYVKNNPVNFTDPWGLDTYYINNEFNSSTPTDNSISHSFIATTDIDPNTGKEVVVNTYSWTSENWGSWHNNSAQDLLGAQKAIDSGIGVDKWGYEKLDNYVNNEFLIIRNETGGYLLIANNCKEKAAELMNKAIAEYKADNRSNK